MIGGILFGLAAALFHSLSYLSTRFYVSGRQGGVIGLLLVGHVIMGIVSLILLPFFLLPDLPPMWTYLRPAAVSSLFYLLGQAGLFVALRRADASRVSPLLGLKLVILAGISVTLLGKSLSPAQWGAVGLAVAAAFALNYSGRPLSWPSVAGVLTACLFYSLSDLNIVVLVRSLDSRGGFRAALMGTFVCYILCGVVCLALLPWAGHKPWRDWPYALPFAATWLGAMVCLFACFGAVGVILGGILQSTRGIISVALGAPLAAMGWIRLEQPAGRGVLLRRLIAAGMMTAAIALFVSSGGAV